MEPRNSPFSNNEDRISKLPDTLIHHILSFIDMRYAVKTSVLSRRWRYIWTCLPTLNLFNYKVVFIDNIFILRDSSSDIRTFRLVCRGTKVDITKRLSTWVVAAVRGNVEEIYVDDNSIYDEYRFPDCLFTCKSLTKLVVKMNLKVFLPKSIHLPRLKSLNLDLCLYDDERLLNKLFSSCPVLESLNVKGWFDKLNLKVSSHTLEHLQLVNDISGSSTLKLHAPNLKSFISSDLECDLENHSSLVAAKMLVDESTRMPVKYQMVGGECVRMPGISSELYAQRLMKYLRAFHNVKDLTLSTRLLEVVPGAVELLDCQPPPQFCNLLRLGLQTSLSRNSMTTIAYLLKISPRIESLYMEITETSSQSSDKTIFSSTDIRDYWEAGLSSTCILPYHLKFVEIRGVQVDQACVNELAFLEVLLKNVMALEKLVIFKSSRSSSFGSDRRSLKEECKQNLMIFRQKLQNFPRASSSIAIFFF